jgi:hypothetical protein
MLSKKCIKIQLVSKQDVNEIPNLMRRNLCGYSIVFPIVLLEERTFKKSAIKNLHNEWHEKIQSHIAPVAT